MARLSGKFELLIDNDETVVNNPQKRIQDISIDLSDDSIEQWQSKLLTVLDGAADQVIGLDSIDSEYLIIIPQGQISIKINTGSAMTLVSGFPFIIKTDSLTSLTVSNSSGANVEMELGLGK